MTDSSFPPDANVSEKEITCAYETVAAATKAASTNFYYAFATLPPEKRNAVYAGYSFCRLADDIVDEGNYGERTDDALDSLQSRLKAAYQGEYSVNEGALPLVESSPDLWRALGDTLHKFPIDQQHLIDVIEGCRMDMNGTTYETWDQLVEYCKRVASATGLALIEVLGYEDEKAVEYAIDLGIALQLTNILRDITEDLKIGRVYLPSEELEEFGVSMDDLRSKNASPEYIRFMKFQITRARKYLETGVRLFPLLDEQSRQCPEMMIHVYELLLDRIEKNNFDTLNQRASLTRLQKLKLLVVIWLRARGLRFV